MIHLDKLYQLRILNFAVLIIEKCYCYNYSDYCSWRYRLPDSGDSQRVTTKLLWMRLKATLLWNLRVDAHHRKHPHSSISLSAYLIYFIIRPNLFGNISLFRLVRRTNVVLKTGGTQRGPFSTNSISAFRLAFFLLPKRHYTHCLWEKEFSKWKEQGRRTQTFPQMNYVYQLLTLVGN